MDCVNIDERLVENWTRMGWSSQGTRKEGAGSMGKIFRNILQRPEIGSQRSDAGDRMSD